MGTQTLIAGGAREFRIGDELELREVFQSSIRELAAPHYAPEQIEVWAGMADDPGYWTDRMRRLAPFVFEADGEIVGYAGLRPEGFIDHFYVAGKFAGRGVGSALLRRLERAAAEAGLTELRVHASHAARAFFEARGFRRESGAPREVDVRGVTLTTLPMRKPLGSVEA